MELNIKHIALVGASAFFAHTSMAQKEFNEGLLKYNITVSSVNGEKIPPGLENATLDLYLEKNSSRREYKTSMGMETSVFNNATSKGFMLKEYSGQKLMITMNAAEWRSINEKNNQVQFTISNETFTINGIKCKKATGSLGAGQDIVVYFNPAMVLANKTYQNAFPQLPGVPVQVEMKSGNIAFTYSLISITEQPVSSVKFDAPQSGFRVMSFAESQQIKKAM